MKKPNIQKINAKRESHLAKIMLDEILVNDQIKSTLINITSLMLTKILPQARKTTSDFETNPTPAMREVINARSIQHSSEDKVIGALLPQYSLKELSETPEKRMQLLDAMQKILSPESIRQVSTIPKLLSILKTIDSLTFFYFSPACPKDNHDEFDAIKNLVLPTLDESYMRSSRDSKLLALTYGIETKLTSDLATEEERKKNNAEASFSGKAKFHVPSTYERFERLIAEFDTTKNEERKQSLGRTLDFYGIPREAQDRNNTHDYAKRHVPWFQKLSEDGHSNRLLPLIASPSLSAARSLITLLHLGAFNNADGTYNLSQAKMYANCLLGYFIFCGHHSALEVIEIWNRVIDYLALNKWDLVVCGKDSKVENFKDWNEEMLPYGRIGNYTSYLHEDYAERLMALVEQSLKTDTLSFRFNSLFSMFKSAVPETLGNQSLNDTNPLESERSQELRM